MHFILESSVPIILSNTIDLERCEGKGEAPEHDSIYSDYGRRIESNRSWTIYHVFSGIPAVVGGTVLTGLDASGSMERMMALNAANLTSRSMASAGKSPPFRGAQRDG